MPKLRHEAVAEILQNEPKLVLSLLAYSGCSLSWSAYVANVRHRHRCDTLLMVFAITENAARGSVKPIRTGHPGWDLVPLISGIGRTPGTPLADGQFGAELVLLRIITGELTLDTHEARMFALAAVTSAPPECRERYSRYLKALAPQSVQKPLETLMKTVLKDAFIDGWIDQGRLEGRLEGARLKLLQLLDKRFAMPQDIRRQVEECADIAKVDAWFDRAITAASLEEVFAELC